MLEFNYDKHRLTSIKNPKKQWLAFKYNDYIYTSEDRGYYQLKYSVEGKADIKKILSKEEEIKVNNKTFSHYIDLDENIIYLIEIIKQ